MHDDHAGFDGGLRTDVPVEEAGAFRPAVVSAGLDPIFLASPTSTAGRMRAAAALSRGFLYVVSRAGTTGEKSALASDLAATVKRARRAARGLPIAVGFGIATPRDAAKVAAVADGVVVGSAIVERIASAAPGGAAAAVGALVGQLAAAVRGARG